MTAESQPPTESLAPPMGTGPRQATEKANFSLPGMLKMSRARAAAEFALETVGRGARSGAICSRLCGRSPRTTTFTPSIRPPPRPIARRPVE